MNFKNLFADDDAVSPVIGVILMVAITVILAAVIGTFVLGLGDQVSNTSPSASFSFDYTESSSSDAECDTFDGTLADDKLTITHDGGDSIPSDQLTITDGSTNEDFYACGSSITSTDDVSAGSSATINAENDDTIRVTWQSSNGGDTATLGKWTGPGA